MRRARVPSKRIVIAGGGTGGHFYPALVLGTTLRERGWEVLHIVRTADPSLGLLDKNSSAHAELDLRGMPRGAPWKLPGFAWKLSSSCRQANRIMEDFKPRAVLGMGGYLSLPAILAAARSGIPRAVHESNAVLGLANRAALYLGAALFRGLPSKERRQGILTGTPIRPALWNMAETASARKSLGLEAATPTLLVFGGSQGARGLNLSVPELLARASQSGAKRVQVIHLTGAHDEAGVRAAYARTGAKTLIAPYMENIELAYAASDIALCRAGASTLAELAAARKPAILVPYSHAAGKHQDANALVFERAGCAMRLPESELAGRLATLLEDLLLSVQGNTRRESMARGYAQLGLPHPSEAAQRLADAAEKIAANTGQQ